ncbi:CRS1 / YhbY CRM domain containing protein [Nitzschia inconspicua]|uniref:CRS1 / YhbY CRM domain containing protein n=1 Tax=Nitzschia inconspicua TaxID=303405 RepID=A0A9K3LUZ6_9STRA|nr:CRS1 / YhbY CRM domain containing protein [Nitzschia inconspicua]
MAFVVSPSKFRPTRSTASTLPTCRLASTVIRDDLQEDSSVSEELNNEEDEEEDMDIEFLFEEPAIAYDDLDAMEKVWRHAKKPLLRIGAKGATHSHGNSLRQLLDDHTVVKVKVNTRKFGSLQNAFESLRDLAVENGAEPGIEMIQMREKDKTILFGLPGTLERMKAGSFPPPPLPSTDDDSSMTQP